MVVLNSAHCCCPYGLADCSVLLIQLPGLPSPNALAHSCQYNLDLSYRTVVSKVKSSFDNILNEDRFSPREGSASMEDNSTFRLGDLFHYGYTCIVFCKTGYDPA